MRNYIRVRHNLNPDTVVEIPLAWLDTSLAGSYTIESEEPAEPKVRKTRRRRKITEENLGEVEDGFTPVNDEDEEKNE